MTKSKKRIYAYIFVLFLLFLLLYIVSLPYINRWKDSKDVAKISLQFAEIQEKIQSEATQKGHYPTKKEASELISKMNLINPHTGNKYVFIEDYRNDLGLLRGQVSYGFGSPELENTDNSTAFICINTSLLRTIKTQTTCRKLLLDEATDSRINYELSCTTNWLGSSSCNESIRFKKAR